jgi:alpha-tubulin suppressor-like RCC1 family protein
MLAAMRRANVLVTSLSVFAAALVVVSACGSSSVSAKVVVKAVSGGWNYALALKSDGSVWAWGANDSGQLGNGTTAGSLVPVPVKSLAHGVIAIAAGWDSGVALKSDGSVWTWGANDRGQLGDGSNAASNVPVRVSGLGGHVTAIAAGDSYALTVKSDGTVWGWGDDYQGQLGDGQNANTITPVSVHGLTGRVVAISAGKAHSLAIEADGSVWAWGDNGGHALGVDTSDVFQNTPVRVEGLSGRALAVAAVVDHSAAIESDGTLRSWGREFLPSGEYMGTDTPTPMPGLTHVKQIAGGWSFFVALEANGSVWAWGENLGTLGDGSGHDSPTNPVAVLGLDKGVVVIGTGVENGYAVTSTGAVWSWGNNNHGELGNGTVDPEGGSDAPVRMTSF